MGDTEQNNATDGEVSDADQGPELRLGVSSCLLGEEVRFDGGHKHDRFLTGTLGSYVRWFPLCPEVDFLALREVLHAPLQYKLDRGEVRRHLEFVHRLPLRLQREVLHLFGRVHALPVRRGDRQGRLLENCKRHGYPVHGQ